MLNGRMTATDLIGELQQLADPDKTVVVIDENEITEPCEFVALTELIAQFSAAQEWEIPS